MLVMGMKPSPKCLTVLLKTCSKCGIGSSKEATQALLGKESFEKLQSGKSILSSDFTSLYLQKGQSSLPLDQNKVLDEKFDKDNKITYLNNDIEDDLKSDEKPANTTTEIQNQKNTMTTKKSFLTEAAITNNLTNLDSDQSKQLVSIGECPKAWDRLELLGGYKSILQYIKDEKIKPNENFFIWLAQCCPPDFKSERELIDFYCNKHNRNHPPSIKIFNVLMERIIFRKEFKNLQQVVRYFTKSNVRVFADRRTLELIARSCHNTQQILDFIEEYCNVEKNKLNIKPCARVYNNLITSAFKHSRIKLKEYNNIFALNYFVLRKIMEQMLQNNVKPNKMTINMLEKARNYPIGYEKWNKADIKLEKDIHYFKVHLNNWLREQKMEVKEDPMIKYDRITK